MDTVMPEKYQLLNRPDGHTLAYVHRAGAGPGILFFSGFNSTMEGDKALALERWCLQRGQQFTRFDYFGHGQSSGEFAEGRIGRWRDDALAIFDQVTQGPQLLVGSSMGGWIMLLLALVCPERIVGLIGLAAAPDFTQRLRDSGLRPEDRKQLESSGFCQIPCDYDDGEPYVISAGLFEEGEQHLLLNTSIAIECPVRLIQGQSDTDVPWQTALQLAECIRSDDVEVILVKSGDHRLSGPADISRLEHTVTRLLLLPA
ncbi:MAG: pimeloyl-ACP methyl ester carboxylesterase [Halieaceae bacterium]|jgi:pimeloyl-ACP methyl ester carboxylesterase